MERVSDSTTTTPDPGAQHKVTTTHRYIHALEGPVLDLMLVPVTHRLGTEDVLVVCKRADGIEIGYMVSHPITPDEVEVIVNAGTATIEVTRPDTPPGT